MSDFTFCEIHGINNSPGPCRHCASGRPMKRMNREELEELGRREAQFQRRARAASHVLSLVMFTACVAVLVRACVS